MADLDELIPLWLDELRPVELRFAASLADCEASFHLRFEAMTSRGWGSEADFPDRIERDEFDDRAVHAEAWLRGRLLASTRMVFPSPGLLMPTEAAFGIKVEPKGKVVDVGRTVVARGLGSLGREALVGVLIYSWREARASGITHSCGLLSAAMIRLYKQLSVEVEILAQPRVHMGEQRYPILTDLRDTDGKLAANVEKRLLNHGLR